MTKPLLFPLLAGQQVPPGEIPDKRDELPGPSVPQKVQEEGIHERTVPIARSPQISEGAAWPGSEGAEVILDIQRQVCIVTAETTRVFSTAATSAASPPYMQVTIEDVQVRSGDMAKFHAIIEGEPQPVVAWFKGISLLADGERVHQFNEGTRYSLVLYNTRPEDGGVYTCIARNTAGEVLCKAELVVQEDKTSQEGKKQSTRRKLHSFYEVKQEIGRGSFGFLKRVVHKGNQLSCAAKFLPLRSKTREQAFRERDILAVLSHGRIAQLLDQFATRKTLILILELCSNEELLDRLFKKNVVTEAEVKVYIKQVLEGIRYLHDNQVLHLDIQPSNILMVYDDRDDIKICDFGFAQKINPAEPQYSKYGSPEFISPEILTQSPVSTASDIWPVGVITYLSLTCKSPFAGENDRATLLNIQNGTISWDIPDVVHLSDEAKDFIRKMLQPAPPARPTALECLSHAWFVQDLPLEEAHFIDTRQLKFFVSRSKWQRSLMSYKSVLVMRPISEILAKTSKNTSLGISRHLVEETSSSSTSGSSSDNEISTSPGRRQFGPVPELHLSVLEDSSCPEYEEFMAEVRHAGASLPRAKALKQAVMKEEPSRPALEAEEELMPLGPKASGPGATDSGSVQEKSSLLLPEGDKMEGTGAGRSPGCVPRHSVIKSTFYSQPSESLANVPSSPSKEHRKLLERAKRTYRKAGYSKSALSGLREPLLEQFECEEGGEGAGGDREAGIGPLIKSASFDTAQRSPKVAFEVSSRSRSLDDYRIRAASFAEEHYIEEEASESVPPDGPGEGAGLIRVPEAFGEGSPQTTSAGDSLKRTRKEDQPALPAEPGERQRAMQAALQYGEAPRPTQRPERWETLPGRAELPLSHEQGTPLPGAEGQRQTAQQAGLAAEQVLGGGGGFHETPEAPAPERTELVLPRGDSSMVMEAPPETIPGVSPASERAKFPLRDAKLPSVQSRAGTRASQGEPLVLKPAPLPGPLEGSGQLPPTPAVRGEVQPVLMEEGKRLSAREAVPVQGGQAASHQKPEGAPVAKESNSSGIPISPSVKPALSVPGAMERHPLPQKPPAPSLARSQEEAVPRPIPPGESRKALSPGASLSHEAVPALHEPKSPARPAGSAQTLAHAGKRPAPLQEKSFAPGDMKPGAIEKKRQPTDKRVPVPRHAGSRLASTSASQEQGWGESRMYSGFAPASPKGKSLPDLMAPQAATAPASPSEAESHKLLHRTWSAPGEVKSSILKGQPPSVPGFSQGKGTLSATPGKGIPFTPKKSPVPSGEGWRRGYFSIYSDTEAEALECLVGEMVSLSKEMSVLAESVSDQEGSRSHVSPSREMFYQGSPGQAVRRAARYPVRRGKREGGIGLADPSEEGILYPGEEDYFGTLPLASKKARLSPSFGGAEFARPDSGGGFRRQRSDRMYEIALVQIQDLWEDMPRPDSKTAKYDISEVEPAFLNLHELYDIVYFPFEFLSFRKAPEHLPSKRRLPLGERASLPYGLRAHLHQDKKMCVREDHGQGEPTREAPGDEERASPERMIDPTDIQAPRLGKRSDSEGDIPVGSQQMFGLSEDPAGKRRSSLQSRLGLFKPFVRSQSMELVEQSLKKKMKASVAHLSRMLARKTSSDEESREDSEERKGEQQERTSLTEAVGVLKKKTGFPSFTLPSFKIKEKAPAFVEELTDQTIALGQSLTLSCRTSAQSSPRVEWFKDGAPLRSTDRILISSTLKHFQLLTVLAATTEDFGTYVCVAANSHGSVSTSCVIRRAETPSNPPAPDIVEVLEDGVHLAWKPVVLSTPVAYSVLCKKDDGEWKTLASDIAGCCYTVEHLPRGLVYSFRIACVSQAGVGPYSNPTAKVEIGEKDQAAFQSQEEEDSKMTASAQPTHQTYAFQTEIKRGRFSIVKQCREKLSGNPLAAKIIPYRQEEKEAVLQEYHILRKLHHTNIGQLQGAYVSPRHLVLILELCVGPELLNALAGRASYSEVEVRDYLWQILSAVEYLHAQNILHLDLRSENMIITEPNLLKVLDFGNAQFYTPDSVIGVAGCTDYVETMASELLSDKGAVPQTDIWAIGVTAFIMLSAEYPISPEAACDFGRLVKREKVKLNRCYAGLSGAAVSFLQSTLSAQPWRRPTATECLQSPWLQETGLDERQQATVTFSTTKLRNFVAERERKKALLCSKYGLMTV